MVYVGVSAMSERDKVRQMFGNRQRWACQRHQCRSNTKEICQDKNRYPCDDALPTYLGSMFDRAMEISEKKIDPKQKGLGDFK
jgi:hypothetical protein